MIPLDNPIWKKLKGGYKEIYNAADNLTELETTNEPKKIEEIFKDFWLNLHHQGDVGLASYFTLPHLIRIGIKKRIFDYNIPALVAVIELARQNNNPPMPEEYLEDYLLEIKEITTLVKLSQNKVWDYTFGATSMAAIAVVNKQYEIAQTILELWEIEPMYLLAFTENYPLVSEFMDGEGLVNHNNDKNQGKIF